MKEFGMEYQAIDALENELENECPQCQTSRYRTDKVTKKMPHKVLHYILIIPCLQQLFRCQSIAQFMDFHAKNRSQHDVLQMPADGSTFRCIKEKFPVFKEGPRNVKLSLAADGVNPFGELRSTYSVLSVSCVVCFVQFVSSFSIYCKHY